MAGLKRTDNKGRILKDGETQRKDGTYRFTYTDADGVRHDVYSKRLVPTDRLPPGCKDDLCLREKNERSTAIWKTASRLRSKTKLRSMICSSCIWQTSPS